MPPDHNLEWPPTVRITVAVLTEDAGSDENVTFRPEMCRNASMPSRQTDPSATTMHMVRPEMC